MKYENLQKLGKRLYFTADDVSRVLGIKIQSARVQCTRYLKQGLFVRLKKNFYVLDPKWKNFSKEDMLRISNFLQVPSYISFMTALSLYEVTTQVQRNFFESVSLKRSIRFEVEGTVFNFFKIKKEYYFDFVKKDDIFIATKEKAFIDMVYLYSLGRYKIDFDSLDISKLNKAKVKKILTVFPPKTKSIVRRLCRI